LYAKPTPPPTPPSTVTSNPPSSTITTSLTSATTNRSSAKGKGRASAQSAGPEETAEQQVTDVDLTGDGAEAVSLPTRGTKRRKEVYASDSVIDLSEEAEASSTRGGKRRHVEMLGDVIVIED
jgi:hypothetical protein